MNNEEKLIEIKRKIREAYNNGIKRRNIYEVLKKDFTQYVLSGNEIKFEIGEIKTTGNLKLKIKVEEYGEYLEYPISA